MKGLYILLILILSLPAATAQEAVYQTFKHGRIVTIQSTETLKTWDWDFYVMHRFGDLLGPNGGTTNTFGLANAADVIIGFRYGLNDNLEVGLSRNKGGSPLALDKNFNLHLKYRLLRQKHHGTPLSLSVFSLTSFSTAQRSLNPASLKYFAKFIHRFTYHFQAMAARKFSHRFSLQLGAGYTHRNIAYSGESNGIVSGLIGMRLQLNKIYGIVADAAFPFAPHIRLFDTHQPYLGIALEIETGGGHIFNISLTNARGTVETDFIPYTIERIDQGEFRLGFTLSRYMRF